MDLKSYQSYLIHPILSYPINLTEIDVTRLPTRRSRVLVYTPTPITAATRAAVTDVARGCCILILESK
jgi:hypothetical protein